MRQEFNLNAKKNDSYLSWIPIFETLSMDQSDEFLKDAGLNLIPPLSLKEICRDFVRAKESGILPLKELVAKTLQTLENTLEEQEFHTFLGWAENRYENHHEQNTQAREWVIPFGRLADYFGDENYPLAVLSLPNEKIMSLKIAFLTYVANVYRFRLRECELGKKPLSLWDNHIYSKYNNETSPLGWISNQIIFMNRVLHWQKIEDLLTVDELNILFKWGIEQSKIMGQGVVSLVHFEIPKAT